MRSFLICLAAALTTAAGIAVAQGTPPAPPPKGGMRGGAMMRADANGDGVITRQEVIDQATKRFDRMDLNHDGKLDAGEMQRIGSRRGMRGNGDMPPPPLPGAPQQ